MGNRCPDHMPGANLLDRTHHLSQFLVEVGWVPDGEPGFFGGIFEVRRGTPDDLEPDHCSQRIVRPEEYDERLDPVTVSVLDGAFRTKRGGGFERRERFVV